MTNFVKRRRSRHASSKEGLSDATNFPLLSSKWTRGTNAENPDNIFSARRLLCFATGGVRDAPPASPFQYKVHDAISPDKDVASTWMEMGSSDLNSVVAVSSSSSTSQHGTSTTQSASSTTQQTVSSVDQYQRPRSTESRSVSRLRSLSSLNDGNKTKDSRPVSLSNRRSATHARPPPPSRTGSSRRNSSRKNKNSMVASEWKSAKDPKSGRTYYYNVKTRETQWRKPMDLASPAERQEMEAKERKQKEFFAAMESNILKSMAQGQVPGTPKVELKGDAPIKPMLEKPRMVRTISGMDDAIIKELVKRVPSLRISAPVIQPATGSSSMPPRNDSIGMDELTRMHDEGHLSDLSESAMLGMEMSLQELNFDDDDMDESPSAREENIALQQLAKTAQEMALASSSALPTTDKKPIDDEKTLSKPVAKPMLEKPSPLTGRRNTCGTIYVGSTMSAPDKDATIKCVCGVYRAHILSSAKDEARSPFQIGRPNKYRIFNDRDSDRLPAGIVQEDRVMEDKTLQEIMQSVPSLDDITSFYRDVFRRAQMESDCIIMSLIYVERLIKATDGGLRPCPSNWRSLLFSCMILSSKVWDDLSMWNADFSQTCPAGVRFSLQRINELELVTLSALDYKVKVPASEYAKYYFLLRSMLIKSGLGGDDIKTMTPLDVEGAKKLEQVSSSFQATAATRRLVSQEDKLRSKSMGDVDVANLMSGGSPKSRETKASLEHMVKM